MVGTLTSTLTCTTYISTTTTTGSGICKLAGTGTTAVCYAPLDTCAYPHNVSGNDDNLKVKECQKYVNDKDVKCTFITGTNCTI